MTTTFDYHSFLATAPKSPGVYDMQDAEGKTLYIGKAKNLKNRLSSYFKGTGLTSKTLALVAKIANIQVMVTNTETEALLLEQNLIKDRRPQYNILLKDDKSYPYLYTSDGDFPRLELARGRKRKTGHYFGPYPSRLAASQSLHLLQKVFQLRNCSESFFRNRSRPCLQHQIGRCKAPCVGLVSAEEYQQDVKDTHDFLQGKSQQLIKALVSRMEQAAEQLQFEEAAQYRNQIQLLNNVAQQQSVTKAAGNVDVIGVAQAGGQLCFDVLFIRDGQVLGHKYYVLDEKTNSDLSGALEAFFGQFYVQLFVARDLPDEIICGIELPGRAVFESALKSLGGKKVVIKSAVRSERSDWLQLANKNAQQQLTINMASKAHLHKRYFQLQQLLGLPEPIRRMECFDISHSFGEATVASCVVFGSEGPLSSDYRRYNIKDVTAGDDYAAMAQVLERRYRKMSEDPSLPRPDLVIVDGGKGQLTQAKTLFAELGLTIPLLGVAKGVTRKAGLETLFYHDAVLNPDGFEAAQLLIQHIRDESHRFAITGHRAKRQKARNTSSLEEIPGIGQKRRSALLKFFGGLSGVKQASVDDLKKVDGISGTMAQQIHDYLNND